MEGVILTTKEQLQLFINESVRIAVKCEFEKFNHPAPITAPAADTLLSRKEAAAVLRISLPTLNELTKSGKISAFRIPNTNRLRYYSSEVNKCLTLIKPAA